MQLVGLRRAPVTEPLDRQGAVPLPRRALRPRPLALPCAQRSLSRLADGRPDARGVSPSGDPARSRSTSTCIRPRSRFGSAISQRVYSHLLSTLRQTFLEERPARAAASDPGTRAARRLPRSAAPLDAWRGRAGTGHRPGASSTRRDRAWDDFELAGGPTDRQTVASWFEAPARQAAIPESVGQPVPPPWAQSLPLGVAGGPGVAFDEFSAGDADRQQLARSRRT